MRFSLRFFLLTIVFIALVIATIISNLKLQQTRRHMEELRQAVGVGEDDRLDMTDLLMGLRDRSGFQKGCNLVRLDNPEDYLLEVVYHDGATQQSNRKVFELTDTIFTIHYSLSQFFIVSQGNAKPRMNYLYEIEGEKIFDSSPGGSEMSIDENPFLVYRFYPPEVTNLDTSALHKTGLRSSTTPDSVIQACNELKIKCVYFRFMRKQ